MKSGKLVVLGVAILAGSAVMLGQAIPELEQGMKPYGSYHGGAIDNINLSNGNLFLHTVLFSYPQRGSELSYPVVLMYNSKNFGLYQQPCPPPTNPSQCIHQILFGPPPNGGDVSQGNSVTIGFEGLPVVVTGATGSGINTGLSYMGTPIYVQTYSVRLPDGAQHLLVDTDRGKATLAFDGSGFFQTTDSDGTVGGSLDRNGNTLSSAQDSLGRSFPTASTASLSACPALNYPNQAVTSAYTWALPTFNTGINNGQLQLTLCYASVYVRTNFFGGLDPTHYQEVSKSFTMLQSVVLPDNTYWAFEYDAADPNNTASFGYGDLLGVVFPTGGTISYTYADGGYCAVGFTRGVKTRTVNANDGTGVHTWQYSLDGGGVVTDPNGNDTVHTFTGLGGTCSLYETKTQYYQGSRTSGTLLKTVNTDYQFTANPWDPALIAGGAASTADSVANVLPIHVTTILPDGQTSRVENDYDAGFTYHGPLDGITSNYWACDSYGACSWSAPTTNPVTNYTASYGKVIAKREYDWGQGGAGPLLRQTLTTYQWQVNSAYLTANLMNLPAVVKVLDGAGNLCAETDYFYDELGYLTTPNPAINTQHTTPPAAVRGNLTTVKRKLSSTPCVSGATWTDVTSHTNWYDTGEAYQSTDPLGHITTYTYDSALAGAYVTQTQLPDTVNNGVTTHHVSNGTYDFNTGLLTSFTDQNQQTSNFANDALWRITQALLPTDPVSGIRPETDFDYSVLNQVKRSKKQTGGTWIFDYADFDGLGRTKQTRLSDPEGDDLVDTTYDPLGRVSTVSNPHRGTASLTDGITTTYYDALGRVVQVAAQDGTLVPSGTAVTQCQANNSCTDYSQFPTVTTTDQAGKMRTSRTDALGRLVEVDEPGGGANGPGTPGTGNINISGSLQSFTSSGTKATGWFTVDGSVGRVRVQVCNDTCIWEWQTDTGGWVSVTVNGVTTTVNYGSNSTSDALAAQLAAQFTGSPVSAYYPGSGSTVYLTADQPGPNYSLAWNAATYDTNYFTDSSFSVSLSGVNLTGGVYPVTTWDSGTLTVTVNGFQASASYNQSLNNSAPSIAVALTNALNAVGSPVTASVSSGSTTIQIAAQGVGTATDYSVTGSSTASFTASSTTLSGGTNPGGLYAPLITYYSYDALGDLTKVNQLGDGSQAARVRTFSYDSLSRLLTANNPESGQISYSYDADGNLTQKIGPAANQPQNSTATQTISYCYDVLNRVTGKGYGAQSCPLSSPVVSYTYDSGANGIGRLTSLTDQAGSGGYTYDQLGRMATESRTIAGKTKSMSYDYNLDGSLHILHYPSGAAVTYTPLSAAGLTAGRMLSAVDTGNSINYATGAAHAPDGSLTSFVSGGTVTNSFSYNKRLQPINMSASTSGQTVFSIGYDFHLGNGDNGNVWGITNYKDNTRNQTFTYDQLNRLASAQNAGTDCSVTILQNKTKFWGNGYTYDAWGNLTNKGNLPGATGPKCVSESLDRTADAQNRLHVKPNTGADFQYDAAGNMTYDTVGQYYSYDQENRITGAAGYTYTYDADGNRVEKTNGTTGTLYWYMTPGIVAESDLNGNLTSEYVFFDGERVARKDLPGGAVSYYFSDHLKTTDIVTDAQGNIKNESDFYPWGGELQFLANDSNHYKFTGKERDTETGLDYFGARYYSNPLGRFTSADPVTATAVHLVNPQRWNMYAYGMNNPLFYIDPDGRDAIAVNFSKEVPGGGHEGIIVVHADGSATYARFGPVGGNKPSGPGEVDTQSLKPVQFTSDGLPTDASYRELAGEVGSIEGQPASTVGFNYFKTSEADSMALDNWMKQMQAASDRGQAPDYQVNTQNCAAFCIRGLVIANAIKNEHISLIPNRLFLLLAPRAADNYPGPRSEKRKERVFHRICASEDNCKKGKTL